MRKQDPNGDYGRAARQRQLLAAVAQKLNSTSTVFKIKDLTAVVGKYIKLTFLFQMALLFTINSLDLILLQYKRSNWKEKIKIGGIYYFLPIQTVLRQYVTKLKRIRRKGKHARKYNNNNNNNNKTESNPSSNSNSNEKAKKETNQDKTPTDPLLLRMLMQSGL